MVDREALRLPPEDMESAMPLSESASDTLSRHIATLDIRQNALVHRRVIGEALQESNWLALDSNGNLLLCQSGNRQVVRMNASLDSP